jgi:butyryl-CoA dehydrogenase
MALLSKEHEQLRSRLRNFADAEILPNAAALDEAKTFPRNLFRRLGELGYLDLSFAFQHPNTHYTGIEGAIILEEISRALPSLGLSISPHVQCMNLIAVAGQDSLQEKLLRRCLSGEFLLGYALSEVGSGSNALNINTTAAFDNGSWILNGEKSWITNIGAADGYVVAARSISSQRSKDVSLFYIDADTPGVDDEDRKEIIGLNNSPLGTLRLKDCVVPADSLIGKESEGYGLMKIGLNEGRYNMAAVALGLAEGALEAAVERTKDQSICGRRLSTYQGVSFRAATMYEKIFVARNSVYTIAEKLAKGENATMESAATKLFTTEIACEVAKDAAQLCGAYGYSRSSITERYLRDAQALTISEGSSEICKVVISNKLFRSRQ